MDAQSSLESLTGVAALVHGLAVHEAVSGRREWIDREPIEEAVFSATSRGLDARLLDGDGRIRPVRELAREALELARPHLAEVGASVDALEGVERILDEGGGADRQRAAHAAGGMPALLQMLVDETAG
jgi:carboxylate-amine ligase